MAGVYPGTSQLPGSGIMSESNIDNVAFGMIESASGLFMVPPGTGWGIMQNWALNTRNNMGNG
jgi:hypothetical protein